MGSIVLFIHALLRYMGLTQQIRIDVAVEAKRGSDAT